MAGKGKAYREKRRKHLVAPSGDEFTIRKPGVRTYSAQFKSASEISELPDNIEDALTDEALMEGAREVMSQQSPEELITSMDALIIACVTIPKVVEHETEHDDEVWIGDIDMADYFFLFKEITEFSGVTAEKLRELFRNLRGTDGAADRVDSSLDSSTA